MRSQPPFYLALLLILVTVGYGVFQARTFITGPSLTVLHPAPGATIKGATYEVRGATDHATHVTLNGRPVSLSVNGNFTETLVTPDGYGTFIIEVTNRFGQSVYEQIEIVGTTDTETS